MDIKKATFVFSQDITDTSVGNFIADLVSWAQNQNNKDKPVQIILNSGGGGVLAGLALHDFLGELRDNGHRVIIKVMGRGGSAAAVVLQAADERIMAPNADLLIHAVIPISLKEGAKTVEREEQIVRTKTLTTRTFGLLVDRSGGKLTREILSEKTLGEREDWWPSAEEAVEYGLADRVEPTPGFGAAVTTDKASSTDG